MKQNQKKKKTAINAVPMWNLAVVLPEHYSMQTSFQQDDLRVYRGYTAKINC